nr:type II toxin-antitoxin system CcdA family antitoxin [Thauera sp. SWB20]
MRTGSSGKRAINLSLSSDVLDAAKQLDINISQVCDTYLREVVRREQERKWREDHADFIAAYNATVEAEGLPLEAWRSFGWRVSTSMPIRGATLTRHPTCWMCRAICSMAWTAVW